MQLTPETLDFIRSHADDDVRSLALKARSFSNIDMPFALDQIAGRQKARTKLPAWAAIEGIVFPPHISMEQCSSEPTALYKRDLLGRFLHDEMAENSDGMAEKCSFRYVDFTGGFGVDFSYIAPLFADCTYIEMQPHLCDIANHNLPLLGLGNAEVRCANAEEVMAEILHGGKAEKTVCFLDPARRDTHGSRTYAIEDCTPNILGFIGEMADSVHSVMLKLSPMLDWHATVASLNAACKTKDAVREVHIVSANNECKEILVLVSEKVSSPLKVCCVNNDDVFSFVPGGENNAPDTPQSPENTDEMGKNCNKNTSEDDSKTASEGDSKTASEGDNTASEDKKTTADTEHTHAYLYVPNASVMKAGCFMEIQHRYGVKQIGANSHLFLGAGIEGFPGRKMQISSISSMNKKELKEKMRGIERANIATRNFPLTPDQLRKRLKLKDGGDTYIFATTDSNAQHILLITKKC